MSASVHPTIDDVLAARDRIAPFVTTTPVRSFPALDERSSAQVFVKCEHLQRAGAFKARGSHNAVFQLDDSIAQRGVVAHSSGNHAAALALAASVRGVPCWVAMPHDAPESKRRATLRYGATIVDCEPTMSSREATVRTIIDDTGATEVHPFDDASVIAGAATATLELLDQQPGLDVIVVPIGGGGLAAGASIVAAASGIPIIAVEPALADDAAESLRLGARQPQREPLTVADGLRTHLGQLNFEILATADVVIELADEDEIVRTQEWLARDLGLAVEPSSAVAFVPIVNGVVAGRRVGVISTGGNC